MPDIELVDVVRGVLAFVLMFAVMSIIDFVITYCRAIVPLRKMMEDKAVAAPPVELTLRYHIDVLLVALFSSVAVFYALFKDFPLNPVNFALILVWADLGWTVHRWVPTYEKVLRDLQDGGNGSSGVASSGE